MRVILGSQSQGRQKVLRQAGIKFDLTKADIDEKAIRHDDYEHLPLLIAQAKADALIKTLGSQEALLITADSIVVYQGKMREKPLSIDQAREFLSTYEPDSPAWVHTGVVVTNLKSGKQVDGFSKAAAYFNEISSEDIEQIILDGISMRCAGGFAIEDPLFDKYILKFDGPADAIIGLPLDLTLKLLKDAEVS